MVQMYDHQAGRPTRGDLGAVPQDLCRWGRLLPARRDAPLLSAVVGGGTGSGRQGATDLVPELNYGSGLVHFECAGAFNCLSG